MSSILAAAKENIEKLRYEVEQTTKKQQKMVKRSLKNEQHAKELREEFNKNKIRIIRISQDHEGEVDQEMS